MEPVLLIIVFLAIGAAVNKAGFVKTEGYRTIANFVFYVCLPAAIILKADSVADLGALRDAFLLVLIPTALVAGLAYALLAAKKIDNDCFVAIAISSTFGNVIYLGVPVSQSVFPDTLDTMAMVIVATNIVVFGILLPLVQFWRKKKLDAGKIVSKIALNPVLISVAIVFALMLAKVSPEPAKDILGPLSSMTTPLSLIAIGIFIAGEFKVALGKEFALIMAFKHLVFPAATFAAIAVLRPDAELGNLALVASVMSPALTNFAVVEALGVKKTNEVTSGIVNGIAIMLAEVAIFFHH